MTKKVQPKNAVRSQIVINLSPTKIEEIDRQMHSLGFCSRGAYLMFLHNALQAMLELTNIEKSILINLGVWGTKNFRETPDVATLANHAQHDEGAIKKSLESLEMRGLLAKVSNVQASFQFDVKVSPEKRYQLTPSGRAAAGAVFILHSQVI